MLKTQRLENTAKNLITNGGLSLTVDHVSVNNDGYMLYFYFDGETNKVKKYLGHDFITAWERLVNYLS